MRSLLLAGFVRPVQVCESAVRSLLLAAVKLCESAVSAVRSLLLAAFL